MMGRMMNVRTASLVAVIVALTVPCYFISSRRSDPRMGNRDPGAEGNLPRRSSYKKVERHIQKDAEDALSRNLPTVSESLAEAQVQAEDLEKWRPTFEYIANGDEAMKLDDYIKWQVGSLGSLVQDKVRVQAIKFSKNEVFDLHGFTAMKLADEDYEPVVNKAMFASFDTDNDGRVAVADLVQWTKEDAAFHGATLSDEQEKMFKEQYLYYSHGADTMDFDGFTDTGLAKVIVHSKTADRPPTSEQRTDVQSS